MLTHFFSSSFVFYVHNFLCLFSFYFYFAQYIYIYLCVVSLHMYSCSSSYYVFFAFIGFVDTIARWRIGAISNGNPRDEHAFFYSEIFILISLKEKSPN